LQGPVVAVRLDLTDLVHHIHSLDHLAEGGMLVVQEIVVHQVDEELAAPGVGPGIGHGNGPPIVSIIISELVFDGVARSTHARSLGISALNHEAVYDSVEDHPIVKALLDQTQEVTCGDGHVAIELNCDVAHAGLQKDLCTFILFAKAACLDHGEHKDADGQIRSKSHHRKMEDLRRNKLSGEQRVVLKNSGCVQMSAMSQGICAKIRFKAKKGIEPPPPTFS